MLVAFALSPVVSDEHAHLSPYIAAAVRVVRESGLQYQTTSMFTYIQGEWDEIMAVIKAASDAVLTLSPRVGLVIKADMRPGYDNELFDKVRRLETSLDH